MINTIINLISYGEVNISSQHTDRHSDSSYKIFHQETPNQKTQNETVLKYKSQLWTH